MTYSPCAKCGNVWYAIIPSYSRKSDELYVCACGHKWADSPREERK